jgi:hypothetical protein
MIVSSAFNALLPGTAGFRRANLQIEKVNSLMKASNLCRSFLAFLALALSAFAAEELIDSRYKPIAADPAMGDWQGSGHVAHVSVTGAGTYQANVFRAFDLADDKPIAVLRGKRAGDEITFEGDGWAGKIARGRFKLNKGAEGQELEHVVRTPKTLGAKPPAGAVVLFDGRNIDAFANKKGKDWLVEDGPAPWKIVDGALEVVPGTGGGIISHQKFGDCHVHAEFRTLGAPTNSGIYLQTRYEVNINESYGQLEGTPNGGLDNCTDVKPRIRASLPPLAWQTLDIDFIAPRFDAAGKKTANARATVFLNGVKLYDQQELNPPKGAAGRLGEAPTGPLMLQEHGMPVQFRNIWVTPR